MNRTGIMDAVCELVEVLKLEGEVQNVKFCLGDSAQNAANVAREAARAISMRQNGRIEANTKYPEPYLDGLSLESVFSGIR